MKSRWCLSSPSATSSKPQRRSCVVGRSAGDRTQKAIAHRRRSRAEGDRAQKAIAHKKRGQPAAKLTGLLTPARSWSGCLNPYLSRWVPLFSRIGLPDMRACTPRPAADPWFKTCREKTLLTEAIQAVRSFRAYGLVAARSRAAPPPAARRPSLGPSATGPSPEPRTKAPASPSAARVSETGDKNPCQLRT